MNARVTALTGLVSAAAVLFVAACSNAGDPVASPDGPEALLTVGADQGSADLKARVDEINDQLEAAGSDLRLDYPWMFRLGRGVDPFGALRTGSRWAYDNLTYVLDESDYTTDVPSADADAALVSSYERWNEVRNTSIEASRIADSGANFDVLDGTIIAGVCLMLFDLTSPNLDLVAGLIHPEADVVMGGWIDPEYFTACWGDPNILGITLSLFLPDGNGDGYPDQAYVEQFYNPDFAWAVSGAVYLDPFAPIDIETIMTHENGHALGLGHFGGPINRQPFRVQPNGKVFNPEAVMNPFYLGGEKRDLRPTDLAGLRTLYARR